MRFALLVIAGCAGGDLGAAGPGADAGIGMGCLSSSECATGQVCNDFGRCETPPPSSDAGVPQETEYEYGPPISSERFVYVAMTEQDELARIDGQTLAVDALPVGESPRVVRAIPNSDGAIALDSINGTVAIVRPGVPRKVLPTLRNGNRLDVDPTGRYAVIWFELEGGAGGIGSFQDVTVLNLAPGVERAVNLTVGFRPKGVQFDALGTRGYVVTEDGVSVIDLGYSTTHPPSIVPPISVGDGADVQITSNGHYAAMRGAATLRIVDVAGPSPGATTELPLASPATDLDLAPDGARVYVVQRDAHALSIVAVPGGASETIALPGTTLGSLALARDGKRALLYTNASLDERLTMVKLDAPGYPRVTWPLKKAVRSVAISPSGTSALVIHAKAPGDPADASTVDEFIDRSYGYSLVDMATGFAKLQITPVDPGAFVYALDGSKVYVALDGGDAVDAIRQLQIVAVQTGVVTTKQLGSPPSQIGILPAAGTAFVAQRHPLGRVTFVGLASDAMRTLTGFDLNSDIVE